MHPFFALPAVAADRWQMQQGERFALDGLLAQLRPRLAIEVGTFEGGSLRRIAAHAEHVHAFDLDPKVAELAGEFDNVTFHIGDSAELLPQVLAELGREGRHVDFALVDGAHTREAVRGDGAALLGADACRQTVIVFHDSANAEVRAGLEDLELAEHPKVALALLDCVPATSCRLRPTRSSSVRRSTASRWWSSTPIATHTRAATTRPSSCPIPALHEAYAAAQEAPARGRAARPPRWARRPRSAPSLGRRRRPRR